MEIDRHLVSGSLTGSRALSRNLEYYYDNQEERQKYQLDYYYSKREYINAKRREAYAKNARLRERKKRANSAYYLRNRVKFALKRRDEARVRRALRAEEAATAAENARLQGGG